VSAASDALAERRATAIVLLSGGLDSGVALAAWRAEGGRVALALFADYGQRAVDRERAASKALAARFDVPWLGIDLPWLRDVAVQADSALVTDSARELPGGGSRERPGDAASAAAVWVPARNVVLIAVAAAHAEALGAGALVVGFNREEAATFPDNSEAFRSAMERALEFGARGGLRLVAPTMELDKPGIARRAASLGLGRDDFWSCYRDGDVPCGTCESCLRSARAWHTVAGS
jgi:7-cyano-7-deazaguanine synthase